MKFWVGITDYSWFKYLDQLQPDEVNFWRPGVRTFEAVDSGEPFLFKLHSPYNVIVGGGIFVKWSLLPISIAWETFGEKNGVPDFETFYSLIQNYRWRESKGDLRLNSPISCIVIANPIFFEEDDWFPQPSDWSRKLMRGKTYNIEDSIGASIWQLFLERIEKYKIAFSTNTLKTSQAIEKSARYGSGYLTYPRLGQGAFRMLVMEAYKRRCAVTGERTLPALTASHIKPYARSGPNDVNNGLLLRGDLHMLFDLGYLTITSDYRIEVSGRIKEEYENGQEYYANHGRKLAVLPDFIEERPSSHFLEWHNQNIFIP